MQYEYLCSNCNYNFEITQSIHDEALNVCDQCFHVTLNRVIHAPYIINHTNPQNMVSLAERNTKKMGKYELESKREADKPNKKDLLSKKLPKGASIVKRGKPKTPWWRPSTNKPVNLKTIKNTRKYIETGNKD